ncbi:fumarylacetoacetate hydrolase family protein [Reinekea marinisedimentorum]|uniref:2-keto-4-pentenoate hydratase/2-oxohepta-3-ene-1,7-dioic acid hydratase in catechol pathway n=1 Tax=Reinekea marinisedimentorum TaxID=230495 RepID=A0A4R3IDQ8_9GAMM|nr:fumarylacetoacetate hydrolase family protein [Reinekea marinisedimentorum]TCS43877.1 2-keto-4-pentenoate hydratase/2-oxohepta-3-ene-1,7-dioic acid hydratase in catechol pathway [Reinekea marinisedimentorum]
MNPLSFNGSSFSPGKIVCIGRNYVEHIAELNNEIPKEMVFFNKPASSISGRLVAHRDEPIHFEAELSFLYQNKKLSAVAFGLDLTKRQKQSQLKEKGLPWERAKAFNGSALFSEFVALTVPVDQLSFTLHIDNTLQQQGDTELMINSPADIVKELNGFMPLQDNDILMTGTPKGVGQITAGQVFTGKVYAGQQLIIEHQWIAQ